MMYRIEFNGRLLDGFDPQLVRLEVGVRLRLRDAQIERLFSGQTVVLKKAVNEENSKAYIEELRDLGLDPILVPLSTVTQEPTDGTDYKVVFWGKVLPGFERTATMAAAAKRLKVPPSVLMQMFCGAKVVLKRNVPAAEGAKLVVELALIGMQIELETEAPLTTVSAQPTAEGVPVLASTGSQEDDPQYGALLQTACDLSGTPFSGYESTDEEVPPVIPVQPRNRADTGIAPANTEGHLNCPRCGLYQVHAPICRQCGVELPKPRLYVGRVDKYAAVAPTTLVNPTDPITPQEVGRKKMAAEDSLYEQMQQQTDWYREESKSPYLKIAIILAAVAAVIAYLLV
jgi:ribosomal protein L37E